MLLVLEAAELPFILITTSSEIIFSMRKMSGSYFGYSHAASHFSQPQQSSYAQHGASAHQGSHVFSPSAATPHTSYVVASTARPSAAAAYETTYTAQPASQFFSATPQRQETHHQQPSSTYRSAAATGYTTYTESTPTYEKQTYYQQPQQSNQSTTYYSAGGGGGGGRGKGNYTAYYQGGSSQQKAKQATTYQTPASSFSTQQAAPKPAQPKAAAVVTVPYTPQSHSSGGGSYHSSPSYTTNKKYNAPSQSAQQQPAQFSGGYSYDAVVFSAASSYYQQQQRPSIPAGMGGMKKNMNGPGQKGQVRPQKPPPKPSQLHYCDICKISCAGPLTYKEHLEGQKHKKKEAALKDTTPVVTKSSQPSYRCELCDVTCTGMDAYNAHIRGSKHGKVLKLHTKLGKPIPSTDPIKINPPTPQASDKGDGKNSGGPPAKKPATKKVVTPKINFVAGRKYSTTVPAAEEKEKPVETKPPETKVAEQGPVEAKEDDSNKILPVGEDYVEEIKNDDGKLISFNCKLCECRFNDPNAKEMHMKGRRHRLQYKKKVDPSLRVEVKPALRNRRQQEEIRKQVVKEELIWRREEEMRRWRSEMRKYDEDMFWRQMEEERYWEGMRHHEEMYLEWLRMGGPQSGMPPPPPRGGFMEMPSKRQENEIDRHVLAKHNTIYPKEAELQAVQNMVSIIERALKMVSDFLAEADKPKDEKEEEVKAEGEESKEGEETEDGKEKPAEETETEKKEQPNRIMKGVMRVGVLAKGLLLTEDLNMELIVLCGEKPTRTLLERVFDCLPKQLAEITEEKYELSLCVEEAAIILSTPPEEEIKMTMKVSLTSPVMRDPPAEADASRDPPDVLDKEKCLAALAALRHAKWFQAKAAVLPSCVVVLRVLRDLCDRIPTWAPMKGWPMELICERVISSAGQPLSPGDALRRIFEAFAGGLILPGGPGIYDPCEREDSDALESVTPQQKEEITASAQHALRLIVFRQVHKVLNMEPIYSQQRNFRKNNNRKRRRDECEAGEDISEGKKDKKDGEGSDVVTAEDGENSK